MSKAKTSSPEIVSLWEIVWEEEHRMILPAESEAKALDAWADNRSIGDQTFNGFCGELSARSVQDAPSFVYFVNDFSI